MQQKNNHLRVLIVSFLVVLLSSSLVLAATLSKGYIADGELSAGMVVSIDPERSNTVSAATIEKSQYLSGVVSHTNTKLIELSDTEDGVQVVTEGEILVLVSNIGGDIAVGDYISASQVSGVGKKAEGEPKILGVARAEFVGGNENQIDISQQLTDQTGAQSNTYLGAIPVYVKVVDNPEYISKQSGASGLFGAVTSRFREREVSTTRIVSALLIFAIGIGISATLLFSGISSSLISIGRNPLSKSSIFNGLWQVILVSFVILGLSIAAVYLLLR